MDLRIGTSGYHYKHWIGRYYPEDMKAAGMLSWYLRDFDTVELNNTFYHLPKESQFDSWRDAVPSDFLYADALTLKELVGTTKRRLKRSA